MAYDPSLGAWVEELLAGVGPITVRRMFGAAGVYSHGLMFGIIDDDVLYLRTDEETIERFRAEGARPFTYPTRDGGEVVTSYWSLPDKAADDPDEAAAWGRGALEAAARKAARRPGRKRRT